MNDCHIIHIAFLRNWTPLVNTVIPNLNKLQSSFSKKLSLLYRKMIIILVS